jgi:DNA-binding NtrC family response regulator
LTIDVAVSLPKNLASRQAVPERNSQSPFPQKKIYPQKVRGGRSRKVAVVDDIAEISDLYSSALRLYGHEIIYVGSSGEEAVEASRRGRLSNAECIIIDYRMGGMSGLEAAKTIHCLNPEIKIVLASADESPKEYAESCGFRFLHKPFRMTDLIDSVD